MKYLQEGKPTINTLDLLRNQGFRQLRGSAIHGLQELDLAYDVAA